MEFTPFDQRHYPTVGVRDGYAEIGGGKLRIRKRRALERLAGQAPGPQRLRPLI